MQQLGAHLQNTEGSVAKQKRVAAAIEHAKKQQLMCDYQEQGVSSWHFVYEQILAVFDSYAPPHITGSATWQYFEHLDGINDAQRSAFFLLVKPLKSAHNKIFTQRL